MVFLDIIGYDFMYGKKTKKMKKLLLLLVPLTTIFWYTICSADLAWYSILNYKSNYNLDLSWNLSVEELINVNFTEERHGIYRDIPFKYTNNFITPIQNVDVKWWKFTTSENWDNFQIKIWDPDKTIKWRHIYSLKYDILWTVRQFDWFQELYWNLLWFEWNTDINNYNFMVTIPDNIKISDKDITIYFWKKWSKDKLTPTLSWNIIFLDKPINLKKNQSVTIVIKFRDWSFKNFTNYTENPNINNWISFNITYEWLKEGIKNFWLILIILFLAWTTCFWIYTTIELPLNIRYKRNYIRRVIHYTPPKWFSATDVSLVYTWHKETEKFILTQIYSWINDWLLIPETKKNLLWIKYVVYKINYKIEKQKFKDSNKKDELKKRNKSIKEYLEEALWKAIKVKKWEVITIWTIKKKFEEIDGIVRMRFINLTKSLTNKPYIPTTEIKKMKVNLWPLSIGWAILAFHLLIWKYWEWLLYYWMIIWTFILIVWLIHYLKSTYRKEIIEDYLTDKWEEVVEQVLWFRKYLLWVEDERLNTLLKEDPNYCEKVLPYAIALWIWSKWIKKCKLINEKIDIDIPEMQYDNSLLNWTEALWALSLISLSMHLPDSDSSWWSNRWSSSGSSSWYSWGWWGGWWGWSW